MRHLRGFLFGLLFLAVAAIASAGQDSPWKVNLDVKEFRLKNGMMFLVVERPIAPQVAVRLAIRTGSALEDSGKTGLAHMLEHMMFKGTKNFGSLDIKKDEKLQEQIEAASQTVLLEKARRNPDQALIQAKLAEMNALRKEVQKIYVPQAFSSQMERNGAVEVNAFTTRDQTQYTVSIPSDMLEQWFSIASEQIFEPSWREFYVEKEVVQREWAFRYINDPEGAAWLDLYSTAFTAHPYRNPVIGWKADMENFSATDAMEFHRKYYNPTNAVCVLAGNVTLEQAKKLAEIYFERYPQGKQAPEEVTTEPQQQGPRKGIRYLKGARTPLVRIGFHIGRMGTRDFYSLDALSSILSEGLSCRMTQQIVEKGLAVEAWAYNPDSRYGDMFVLGGSPNDPKELKDANISEEVRRRVFVKSCEDLERILLSEVEKLKTELVSQRELDRVKKLNQRSFLDRMRSNEQLAGTLATLEVETGWRYMTTYLEKIASVTPEDIRDAANKYLVAENKTSTYVIPGGDQDLAQEKYVEIRSAGHAAGRLAGKMADQFDKSSNNSIYPTPVGWRHPLSFERKPKKIEYPETKPIDVGASRVFFLPDKELPLIDLTLLIKAGEVDVDDSKAGLSGLINGCLVRGGTEKHPPTELAQILDENAIQLMISVAEEQAVVQMSVMKDDWKTGLLLLKEILTMPEFAQEVLDVAKQQAVTLLKRQGGDAQSVLRREAKIFHFKGHPYGRDPLLGLETIPALTRDDLKTFLKSYFVPSNMVVSVAGDIEKTEVVDGVKGLLKALPQEKAPGRNIAQPTETPPVLTLIHKPGQVQSQVGFMLPSVCRTNPDFWKIGLLMDIFGGGDSLIYTRLRDDLGLIYAGWFFQAYNWKTGILIGYLGCKADMTRQAINETVNIMAGLKSDVPEKLFEQKQLDALNGFVFNVDTPAELVKTYATYYLREEPLNTLEMIQDSLMGAKREELEALAGRFLDPQRLQVFVVGDKMTQVKRKDGSEMTLEQDLKEMAKEMALPYQEIGLR
jgi:predicted Zn-dependent peptidase